MKTCPKCREMNDPHANICTMCGASLAEVADEKKQYRGMHWFWAFLMMLTMSISGLFLMNIALVRIFEIVFATRFSMEIIPLFLVTLHTCNIVIGCLATFVWIKLTIRRYGDSEKWRGYSYSVLIVSSMDALWFYKYEWFTNEVLLSFVVALFLSATAILSGIILIRKAVKKRTSPNIVQ